MPRPTRGPYLGGSTQHERHLPTNLATQLIIYESVKTTEARVRCLRPYVEKLTTKGKRGGLHVRHIMPKKMTDKCAVRRLFEKPAPKSGGREGGHTRIIEATPRKGDNVPMVVISLALEPVARKEIVEDAIATVKRAAQKTVADEDKAEKEVTAEKTEKADEVDKADEAERAGTVRLEEGATDAPDDDHLVRGNEDPTKYHVPGLR